MPREVCGLVPREQCKEVSGAVEPGKCRANTRLECSNQPRQKCGKTVRKLHLIVEINPSIFSVCERVQEGAD